MRSPPDAPYPLEADVVRGVAPNEVVVEIHFGHEPPARRTWTERIDPRAPGPQAL